MVIPGDCNPMYAGRRRGDTILFWIRSSRTAESFAVSRATSYRKTTTDSTTIAKSTTTPIHPQSTRGLFRRCSRIVFRRRKMRTCSRIMATAFTHPRLQFTSSFAKTRRRGAYHFRRIFDRTVLLPSRSRGRRKSSSRSCRASRQPLC